MSQQRKQSIFSSYPTAPTPYLSFFILSRIILSHSSHLLLCGRLTNSFTPLQPLSFPPPCSLKLDGSTTLDHRLVFFPPFFYFGAWALWRHFASYHPPFPFLPVVHNGSCQRTVGTFQPFFHRWSWSCGGTGIVSVFPHDQHGASLPGSVQFT